MLYSILHNRCASSFHLSSTFLSESICSSPTFSELKASMNPSRLSLRLQSSLSKEKSKIELCYESYYEDAIHNKLIDKERLLTFQGFCAYTIQAWWKEKLARRKESRKVPVPSVLKVARSFSVDEAASIIQLTWRRHIDLQVFTYYKKLINFQNKGDPNFMLKCINPKEAELLDNAAGVHVRFRLGGIKFPPCVYYKIYSHINVADIGSFAPRHYTKASSKHLPGKYIHNKSDLDNNDSDEVEWYERVENNGWRLVNQRLMRYLDTDPISCDTSHKKINYNHDKLVRHQDVALRKKQKKLKWMKKMYTLGVLKVRHDEEEEVKELVNTAAQSIFTTMNDDNVDAIEDWEVNELLQWTEGLNFDRIPDGIHINIYQR